MLLTVGPAMNQPERIAPMEYVVFTRPNSSPDYLQLVSLGLVPYRLEPTYWVVEPSEPLFVDLDVIENSSIKTI